MGSVLGAGEECVRSGAKDDVVTLLYLGVRIM